MFELAYQIMDAQVECLTQAIYHEARSESYTGQLFVGFVIRNRVMSDKFPDDFCQVIEQPWQFSFVHELDDHTMREESAAEFAQAVAEIVMTSDNPLPEEVLYYHTIDIKPDWNYDLLTEYQVVNRHIFYREVK